MKAFDKLPHTFWEEGAFPKIFSMHLSEGKGALSSYEILAGNSHFVNRMPKVWKVLGSLDGVNWEILDQRKDQIHGSPWEKKIFKIHSAKNFDHYSFVF